MSNWDSAFNRANTERDLLAVEWYPATGRVGSRRGTHKPRVATREVMAQTDVNVCFA